MSEPLHPGLHPDPDSLNAFVEGVLPDHERMQCLAHLAECPRCREVVFLAQEPPPAPAAPRPVLARGRWFAPAPVLGAAVAVCMAVLAVWLYSLHTREAATRDRVARVSRAPATPAQPSVPNITRELQLPKPPQTSRERDKAPARSSSKDRIRGLPFRTPPSSTHDATPPGLPTPPAVSTPPTENAGASLPPAVLSAIPAPPRFPDVKITGERAAASLSGISGTITDATGAAIPGATIKVRQLNGTISADASSDVAGQFQVAELPAGRYELQIAARGFRLVTRQVDLQPREVASVKSQLEVGALTEVVEVTAAAPVLQTSNASQSARRSRKKAKPEGPRPLPSKLPPANTVASGRIMLAVDSSGAAFVSQNSGKRWKTVKPVWTGKVRRIAPGDPSQISIAAFQLTTDSGAVWLSRDGAHWYPAPPER